MRILHFFYSWPIYFKYQRNLKETNKYNFNDFRRWIVITPYGRNIKQCVRRMKYDIFTSIIRIRKWQVIYDLGTGLWGLGSIATM